MSTLFGDLSRTLASVMALRWKPPVMIARGLCVECVSETGQAESPRLEERVNRL